MAHVEFVIERHNIVVEVEMGFSAGGQGDRGYVDQLQDGTVVLLEEGNVENLVGVVGEVETGHAHHKHEITIGAGGHCELIGLRLVFGVEF